ncbi:MAG TPA: regulatory protein RecX [Bacteroidales bacterium]|nr:regulatory protein RecX [Bacteroidales bacterium]
MSESPLFRTALSKAMKLCSGREFCKKDIREKASSWGVSQDDSEKIITLLVSEKFIDEHRYATAYVRDKFNYNKWGKVKIAAGLKMKGIPHETIREAIDSLDVDKYRQCLGDLINSQRKRVKSKNLYDLKGKLMRYGLSKGFESSLLYEILGEEF